MSKFLVIVLIFISFNSYSHVDTVLKLEDGKLIGLPDKYLPAFFDKKNLVLIISDQKLVFPECIKEYFNFDMDSLLITASWYHTSRRSSLPPYITIGLKGNYPHNLLINIDDLAPIPIEWGYGKDANEKACLKSFGASST